MTVQGKISIVVSILTIVFMGVCVRYMCSLHPHSGQGKPPMYGDFEAQRHWIEITNSLPIEQWYVQTKDNDLQYWGLDYPPLTAYHSLLIGKATHYFLHYFYELEDAAEDVYEEAFGLHVSRGSETNATLTFMRASAMFSDLLVYFPLVICFVLVTAQQTAGTQFMQYRRKVSPIQIEAESSRCIMTGCLLLLVLFALPLIVIDHGHFQYNMVAEGLVVFAVFLMMNRSNPPSKLGIIFGILIQDVLVLLAIFSSIFFKQMSLYYAPAFAFYFLSRAISTARLSSNIVGATVIFISCCFFYVGCAIMIIICVFAPFLIAAERKGIPILEIIIPVVHRMFPFSRGLFEDKVASFWCAISIVFKLPVFIARQLRMDVHADEVRQIVLKCCTSATILGLLPSSFALVRFDYYLPATTAGGLGRTKQYLRVLACCSLSFFLFSFQVHEKSILLPLLPISLLGTIDALQVMSFRWAASPESIAASSARYNGHEAVACFHFISISLFSMFPLMIKDNLLMVYFSFILISSAVTMFCTKEIVFSASFVVSVFFSILGMILIHLLHFLLPPPAKYPDLITMLFVIYSCGHFIFYLLYFTKKAWQQSVLAARQYHHNIEQDQKQQPSSSGSSMAAETKAQADAKKIAKKNN